MGGAIKCRICGIPLNKEIVSKKDPNLCFECAEEKRAFTPNNSVLGFDSKTKVTVGK